MTLLETIYFINTIAKNQPNINGIVETGDIFDLNKDEYQQKYAAFCATQGEHEITESWSRFSFILYYVDRLNLDKSNKDEIHSTAIEFFHNLNSTIYSKYPKVEFIPGRVVTFTERFSAECAGAYMTCEIVTTPKSLCPIEFRKNPEPEPEPVTITTYELKGEIKYYEDYNTWVKYTQGGNFAGSYIGQSTSPVKVKYLFNEIHFPLRIADINNYTGTDRLIQYLVIIRKPIEGAGNANTFLPCFGYPDFDVTSSTQNNCLAKVVSSGYIDAESKTYDDYVIKCDKTFTVNPGEVVMVLIHALGKYVYMRGAGSSSSQIIPLFSEESKTFIYGIGLNESLRYSPFVTSWCRYIFSPTETQPSRNICCQPVLKLTTYV